MYKPALSNIVPGAPDNWGDFLYGEELKSLYEEQLSPVVQQCFGYHLVKLGNLSQSMQLTSCKINHQISHTSSHIESSGVVSSPNQLPYAEKSIDSFVLIHELDFAQDPHQVLREIDHCLIPNGKLILVGFNPFSPAGVARFLPISKTNPIKQARFFSRSRVNDWLSLLGYEICEQQRFLFADFAFGKQLRKSKPWHPFLQRYFSFFASVYIIVGKKREIPLSPIKPKWKPVTNFSPVGASLRWSEQKLLRPKKAPN